MEMFALLMEKTFALFKTPLTLWGFTFSFWEIFVFSIVAGLVTWILYTIFLGD